MDYFKKLVYTFSVHFLAAVFFRIVQNFSCDNLFFLSVEATFENLITFVSGQDSLYLVHYKASPPPDCYFKLG